jgi:hypothetical protein
MAIRTLNGNKIYQHFPVKGLPKYSKIGDFGMPIYHLATLTGLPTPTAI